MGASALLTSLALAIAQAPAAPAAPAAEVSLEAGDPGIAAHYRFSQPADRLRLGAPLHGSLDRVTLDGADGRLSGGEGRCGEACEFTGARLHRFAPSRRAYPEFIEAGACGLWAELSAFAPIDPVTGDLQAGAMTLGGREIALTGEAPQYAAVRTPERGPACAAVPVLAEDRLAASAARMSADYGTMFGHLPGPPRLILAERTRADARPVSGAAAGDDLIFLFADPDAAPQDVLGVLSHEIAHLWIGRRARLHPQFEQAWIYEGAAEYLSLKQRLRIEAAEPDKVAAELERHAGGCLAAIDDHRLTLNRSSAEGPFPYHCGTLTAFYADQAMQAAGSSFEAAIADMVADPAFKSADASALEFVDILGAHMGAREESVLREVVLADRPNKQARFLSLLSEAGLGEEGAADGPAPAHLAAAAARHVTETLCPAGGGRFWIDRGVVLELSAACEGPEGTSELTAVAGAAPLEAPRAALEALERCAAGGAVEIVLGAEPRSLTCGETPLDYFRGFALNRTRALEILRAAP
ncbi:MAG: hypothetical protein ACFE0P_07600 [Oceanicaulis sp.]